MVNKDKLIAYLEKNLADSIEFTKRAEKEPQAHFAFKDSMLISHSTVTKIIECLKNDSVEQRQNQSI